MSKQIQEQIVLLRDHVDRGHLDLEFISLHARHLLQLADYLRQEKLASEISDRQREFMRLVGG